MFNKEAKGEKVVGRRGRRRRLKTVGGASKMAKPEYTGWRDLKGGKQRKGLARGRRSHLRARKRFPLSMEV